MAVCSGNILWGTILETIVKEWLYQEGDKEEHRNHKVLTEWKRPGVGEMRNAVRNARGSGGTDGWTGKEVRDIPEEAISLFYQITERWECKGDVPGAMKEARQVNLPKEGKES